MYRFRKAGNFVQVEVRAPNNASETFKDDACFCTAENAVRFRAGAPNNACVAFWETTALSMRYKASSILVTGAKQWSLSVCIGLLPHKCQDVRLVLRTHLQCRYSKINETERLLN
jgi:hypothetical protein